MKNTQDSLTVCVICFYGMAAIAIGGVVCGFVKGLI